jgi:hypothetical protein
VDFKMRRGTKKPEGGREKSLINFLIFKVVAYMRKCVEFFSA